MSDQGSEGKREEGRLPVVFVLSDALGETAELVARAAASQFNGGRIAVRRIPYVRSREGIAQALELASKEPSVVVYTLLDPELGAFLREESERRGIHSVDLLGPTLEALTRVSRLEPRREPGLLHRLDEAYFQRIEAVEFTVKADDGRDPRALLRADVVLIGVSRASKTPVSMYLAHRGHKVANVPLVPEVEPPIELFQIPAGRVVGLVLRAEKLRAIRQERLKSLGLGADAAYADLRRINEEIAFAQGIYRRLGCATIDVSDRAVEETASRVLEILRRGVD